MSTYPTTPPRQKGTPCYTCAHLYDIAPLGHTICNWDFANTGLRYTVTYPDEGCSYWRRDPARPEITTFDEWIAVHGRGLTGFSERKDRQFRPPLTAQDAREAVQRGDVQALGWEVARLRDVERRFVDAILYMLTHIEVARFREDLKLLVELAAKQEPAVAAHLTRQAAEKAKLRR